MTSHFSPLGVAKRFSESNPVFIVAEAGINHNGDIKLAEKLIHAAKASGADAIKFQTYMTEKRVAKNSPIFGILKSCELSHQEQEKLFKICRDLNFDFFSTPFDEESAEFLTQLGVNLMKIASFDLVNLKLLRAVASKRIPVIASRGMANESETDVAVNILKEYKVEYALLHCISSYPNKEENANLKVIQALKNRYSCVVGFSDHTLGIKVPVLSVAAGAKIIEKHFTMDRNMEGPDHSLSCDPEQMQKMVSQIRETEKILGDAAIKMYECEQPTSIYRRVSS